MADRMRLPARVVLLLVGAAVLAGVLVAVRGCDAGTRSPDPRSPPQAGVSDIPPPDVRGSAGAGSPEPDQPAVDEDRGGDLSVEVTSSGNAPIAGARVLVEFAGRVLAQGVADASGRARWTSLRAERVDVGAWAPGFAPAWVTAELGPGLREVRLGLQPGAVLRGRVLDAATRRPLPAHHVRVLRGGSLDSPRAEDFAPIDSDEHALAHVETDRSGEFEVSLPPDLIVTVATEEPGWSVTETAARAGGSGAGREVELIVHAASTLYGRVLPADPEADPEARAVVFVAPARFRAMLDDPGERFDIPETWARDQIDALRATVAKDGAYELPHLVPGTTYSVVAVREGEASRTIDRVRAPLAGERVQLDLTMAPLASYSFRLELPEGVSKDAVDVRVDPVDGGRAGGVRVSDDGTCEIRAALPGRYVVQVSGDGFPATSAEIRIGPGADEPVVRVAAGLAVEGVVVREDGSPLAGVRVACFTDAEGDADTQAPTVLSGENGSFRIVGLAPVPTVVAAPNTDGTALAPLRVVPPARGLRLVGRRLGSIRFEVVAPAVKVGDVLQVRAQPAGGEMPGGVDTQARRAEGSAEFVAGDFPPGDWIVTIVAPGAAAARVRASVEPGRVSKLDPVEIGPGASLCGQVRDPSGLPLGNARVKPFGRSDLATTSEADGVFCVAGLAAGETKLTVERDGFPRQNFVVACDGVQRPTLTLEHGGLLRGDVIGQDGSRGAEVVHLHVPSELAMGTHDVRVVTDAGGHFEKRLLRGTYVADVVRDGAVVASKQVTVEDEAATELTIELPPGK